MIFIKKSIKNLILKKIIMNKEIKILLSNNTETYKILI